MAKKLLKPKRGKVENLSKLAVEDGALVFAYDTKATTSTVLVDIGNTRYDLAAGAAKKADNADALGGSSLQNIVDKINNSTGDGTAFTGLDTTTNNKVKLTRANGGTVEKTINNVSNSSTANYSKVSGKIGTGTVGSSTKPVYINAGIPTAVSSIPSTFVTAQQINGVNLDALRTPGMYWAGGSNTNTNKPTGIDAFGLEVLQSAAEWYTQICYASDNQEKQFIRYYNSTSWTDWVEQNRLNTKTQSGYAPAPNAANKVYRTDASGNPGWGTLNDSSIGKLASTVTFGNGSSAVIDQNNDTYRQRINIFDNAIANDAVFSFQQSTDAGKTYKDLFAINDNGTVVAGTFQGALKGTADYAKNSSALEGSSLKNIVDKINNSTGDGTAFTKLDTSTNNKVKLTRANGGTVEKIINNVSNASSANYAKNSAALGGSSLKNITDRIDSSIAANDAMHYMGTLGAIAQKPTITALPTTARIGDAYKVITAGTYASIVAEVGDLFIYSGSWTLIPSGDDGNVYVGDSKSSKFAAKSNNIVVVVGDQKVASAANVTANAGTISALQSTMTQLKANQGTVTTLNGNKATFSTLVGRLKGDSDAAYFVRSTDTRTINTLPSTYMTYGMGSKEEFKENTAIGLAGADNYSHVITHIPWANSSGGRPFQVAYSGTKIFTRGSASDSAWGEWHKVITGADALTSSASAISSTNNYFTAGATTAYVAAKTASAVGNYLPLSGGTMNGTAIIRWADSGTWGNTTTFPVKRGGLSWTGQSDGIELFAEETGGDNLELIAKFTDDNSNGFTIRNASNNQVIRLAASGAITGGSLGVSGGISGSNLSLSGRGIQLNRRSGAANGRISWWDSSYHTWFSYMSNPTAGAAPTGGTPSTYGSVTSWAQRSLIENASGYGWIWESAANTTVASSVAPTPIMSLSSKEGNLRVKGNVTPEGQIIKGGASVSWLQGHKGTGVLINQNTYTGYNPLFRVKTEGGAWTFGPYSSNVLYLNYATDAIINGTQNTSTKQITINPSGDVDGLGKVTASTVKAYLNGVASTAIVAAYPQGFQSRSTSATWGNTTGTFITGWHTSSGGDVAFMNDNPSNGKVSMKLDGYFYQNEGSKRVLDTDDAANYVKKSGDTMTGTLTIKTGDQKGIKLGSAWLTAASDANGEFVLQNGHLRFGSSNWDYNQWAGLKYDAGKKNIYLGLADGAIFTANSAQSGGSIFTPGVDNIYIGASTATKVLTSKNIGDYASGKTAFTELDTTTNNVIKLTRANGATVQKTINNVASAGSATNASTAEYAKNAGKLGGIEASRYAKKEDIPTIPSNLDVANRLQSYAGAGNTANSLFYRYGVLGSSWSNFPVSSLPSTGIGANFQGKNTGVLHIAAGSSYHDLAFTAGAKDNQGILYAGTGRNPAYILDTENYKTKGNVFNSLTANTSFTAKVNVTIDGGSY